MALKLNYYYEFYERDGVDTDVPTTYNRKMGWIAIRRQRLAQCDKEFKPTDPRSKIKGNTIYLYHATDGLNFLKLMKLRGIDIDLELSVYTNAIRHYGYRGHGGRFAIPGLVSAVGVTPEPKHDTEYYKQTNDVNDGMEFINFLIDVPHKKGQVVLDEDGLRKICNTAVNRIFVLKGSTNFRNKFEAIKKHLDEKGFANKSKYWDSGPLWQILMLYYQGSILVNQGDSLQLKHIPTLTISERTMLINGILQNTKTVLVEPPPPKAEELMQTIDLSKASVAALVKARDMLKNKVDELKRENSGLEKAQDALTLKVNTAKSVIGKLEKELEKYLEIERALDKKMKAFKAAEGMAGKRRLVLE